MENMLKEIVNVKVNKNDIIAESRNSILLEKSGYSIWLSKKFTNPSQYTNILSLGLSPEFKYTDGKDENKKYDGNSVIKFLVGAYPKLNINFGKEKVKKEDNIALQEIKKELDI